MIIKKWVYCFVFAAVSPFVASMAEVNKPAESFTLDFSENNPPVLPEWIADVRREGGALAGNPSSWVISKDEPNMTGRLLISLNPEKIPADLSLTMVYEDLDDSEFFIQLLDGSENLIVPDMFSSIVRTSRETKSDTYIINFVARPTAKTIAIQRASGPLKLHGLSLMSVVCELPSTVDVDRENCLASSIDQDTEMSSALKAISDLLAGQKVEWSGKVLQLSQQESQESLGRALISANPLPEYVPSQEIDGMVSLAASATSFDAIKAVTGAFKTWHPNLEIELRYDDTPGVEQLLHDGIYKLVMLSHPMSKESRETFFDQWNVAPVDVPFAVSALQILVHKNNPVTHVTLSELEGMYAENQPGELAEITAWSQLSEQKLHEFPLNVYSGQPEWGTSQAFSHLAMQGKPFNSRIIIDSVMHQNGIHQAVALDPGGIGFVVRTPLSLDVRVLPVAVSRGREAYLPNAANIYSGSYPLTRKFYLTLAAGSVNELATAEKEFVDFLLSQQGQLEIARNGLLPLTLEQLYHARKLLSLD